MGSAGWVLNQTGELELTCCVLAQIKLPVMQHLQSHGIEHSRHSTLVWSSPGSTELAGHRYWAKPTSCGLAGGPVGQEFGTEQPGIQECVPVGWEGWICGS